MREHGAGCRAHVGFQGKLRLESLTMHSLLGPLENLATVEETLFVTR
jgi:hypothetical protein